MTRTPGQNGLPDLAALSPRETDIVKLVRRGKSAYEIGDILNISPKTADNYIYLLGQGLRLSGRHELMLWVLQNPQVEEGKPARIGLHREGCDCGSAGCPRPFEESRAA